MADKTGRAEATHRERAALGAAVSPLPSSWPQDAEGNYLALVSGSCSDLVPTVQFGNVLIGPVTIQRPVVAGTFQEIIDAARETQRAAEYVVGVERRALQWAIDPAMKVASPIPPEETFAAPPVGYDPNVVPPHPADQIAAEAQRQAVAVPASDPPSMAQDLSQTTAAEQALTDGPQLG